MQFFIHSRTGVVIAAIFAAALCRGAQAQDAPSKDTPAKDAQNQTKGLPARATPSDYFAHSQAGPITIAAEFSAHSISSPEIVLNTEDYVVVEVAFFGPPDAHVNLSGNDFSLRINKKKLPLQAQPYAMVFGSLKDPEWEPPDAADAKSKTSIGSGAGQTDPTATPKIVHVPIALERSWQARVQKAALPEGERTLPTAGLIFFKYHGKASSIDSLELMYAGSAGKVTLNLHP